MASSPRNYASDNTPDNAPPVIAVILVLTLIGFFGMLIGGGITWAVIRLFTC